MRYRITKEGVEMLLESAAELKRYARYVMEEIISHVSVWGAIADLDLEEGRPSPGDEGAASSTPAGRRGSRRAG